MLWSSAGGRPLLHASIALLFDHEQHGFRGEPVGNQVDERRMWADLRLLHLESNPDDRAKAVREIHRLFPHAVISPVTDAAAFERALEKGAFDVALSDYELGWSDGLTVLSTIKSRYPECPVIMLTGSSSVEIAIQALDLGLDDYVLKSPGEISRLSVVVSLALERVDLRRSRNASEAALKESEDRFRTLAALSPVGICRRDAQGGCVYASERACEITGLTLQECLGVGWMSALHPADRERVEEEWKGAWRENRVFRMEYRFVRPDGRTTWVLHQSQPEKDDTGKVIGSVSTMTDITEQKLLEETLRESEAGLRALNQITCEPEWSFDQKVHALLLMGCRQFDLPIGMLCRVEGGRRDVIDAVTPPRSDLAGTSLPLEQTFCRETVLSAQPVLIEDAAGPARRNHPARAAQKAESYFGIRIVSEGRVFGTLSFSGPEAHRIPSEVTCKEILRLMARWIGVELDQQHDEQELLRSRMLLVEAQEVGRMGSWDWIVSTGAVTWSDGLYLVFGQDPDEFVPTYEKFLQLVLPEDRRDVQTSCAEAIHSREPLEFEYRIRRPDGAVRIIRTRAGMMVDVAGQPLRMVGMAQDVTERRKAAAALEKLAAFTSASPYPILEFDAGGNLTFHNAAAQWIVAAIDATERGEALKQEISGIVNGCLASGEQNIGLETIVEGRILTWTFVPIPAERVVHAHPIDITQRLDLEMRLRHSQKLEAVGRLAGGVSHDFNNLLTVINGYCEFIMESAGPDFPMHEDLEEVRRAGERAAVLTRQLLAFSRRQVLQPAVIDLNDQIAEVSRMLRRLLHESIEVSVEARVSPAMVKVDPGQMEQVIINLALNARDAMPDGGKLTIEISQVELATEAAPRHVGLAPGRYVVLSMKDTGTGMDLETRSHMFEPFFTTKERDKGTGLGLSTVHGIIKQSGGDIWVDSSPGKGTTFKIFLPPVEGAARPAPRSHREPSRLGGSETILLVEDDETVRRMAARSLQYRGYRVLTAGDGEEALRAAERHGGPIDVTVTDVIMPRLGGLDLARRLAARYPRMRVLYVSGYVGEALIRRSALDPTEPFLQKPFTPAVLIRKVRELLDRPFAETLRH